ncbi:MAG: hypothetical protein ACREQN_05745 [Candidatus Binataceae bacterium]
MSEYQGYSIKHNADTEKWDIYWEDKRVEGDFAREADAEEWIDEQFPLNR